ncbi:hypothetical protein [Xiamenia xianingshaonis]|uniref:Uncharacterized protein n=1 Tax=Xiamenia xianingshaonis TaxID=2682776 RepID=A0ABX0IKG6_9ACTN|nr:hypothetical protein [Xiamenia xianingshaonis]NHM13633.1 hypothetical protein [Xiamenia xianingshaonis]
MVNTVAAIGTFGDDGAPSTVAVPDDINEVLDTLNAIVDKYNMGDVLSDEDHQIVKAYLPAIGVEETSMSAYDALLGSGSFKFNRADKGLELLVQGDLGCRDSGEARIEWWGTIDVQKTSGDTVIKGYDVTFRGASFGMGPTGKMKLIYKRDFDREFPACDQVSSSFTDRFSFTQWGFFFSVSCDLTTNEGDIVIR